MQVQPRRLGEGVNGMGMGNPEGEDNRGAGRQVEVIVETIIDLVEKAGGVEDRLGPGDKFFEFDAVGRGIVFEALGAFEGGLFEFAGALDAGVESADAEIEAFGFGAAEAVVLGEGQLREAGEGLIVGFGNGLS